MEVTSRRFQGIKEQKKIQTVSINVYTKNGIGNAPDLIIPYIYTMCDRCNNMPKKTETDCEQEKRKKKKKERDEARTK